MIERIFYDREGRELLSLYRWTREQALLVRSESLPDLAPIGQAVEVPGTGQKVFLGERRPKAGQLTITIATHGRDHDQAFALQREILGLVPEIAAYTRVPGGTLDIAGYASVKRSFQGSAQFGGAVELTLECASPYFWTDALPLALQGGVNTVRVGGRAPTGLRLELTAASSGVTDPTIITDAGQTTWHGTVPAGGVLTLDGRRGWAAKLGDADVSVLVSGPVPALEPGTRTLSIPNGMTGRLWWREGEY